MKLIMWGLASILTIIGILVSVIFIYSLSKEYTYGDIPLLMEQTGQVGDFLGGVVGTVFSIVGVILLIYTIHVQSLNSKKSDVESYFFKMIDYHNQNVNQMKAPNLDNNKTDISEGRRAFVQFKIQISKLLKTLNEINDENDFKLTPIQILDISYIVFYYGMDGSWIQFIIDKLKNYPNNDLIAKKIEEKIKANQTFRLGRTNQTNLSTYFRNMYNAIKMVDESIVLSDVQKKNLIKIYRAQLSNPELYVLFFNLLSRFGKRWIENNYIQKYEFIKNIPRDYCDGYDPRLYFDIQYEYEEY